MTPRKREPRPLTSTDIVGMLYKDGITVSREWLAGLSSALFDDELKRIGGKRIFSNAQAAAMVAGAKLARCLGVPVEDLASLAGPDEIAAEKTSKNLDELLDELASCKAAVRKARSTVAA